MKKFTINLATGTVRVMAKNRLEALKQVFGKKEEVKKEIKEEVSKKKKQKNKD